MACDILLSYENQSAFQFIRDVGINWEQTQVLNGEVGEFVTIALEERATGNWFLGSVTNQKERELTIDFSFLPANTNFSAIIYKDGVDAHWDDNPTSIDIDTINVNNQSQHTFYLAEGGEVAISMTKN